MPGGTGPEVPHVRRAGPAAREARRALGEHVYGARFEEGMRLTLDEAFGYALGEQPATGVEPAPTSRSIAAGPLTPREQQIAELVAQGLTNQRIATRLVISRRTAEGHVENILTKLDFTNRVQITRWITDRRRRDTRS